MHFVLQGLQLKLRTRPFRAGFMIVAQALGWGQCLRKGPSSAGVRNLVVSASPTDTSVPKGSFSKKMEKQNFGRKKENLKD